MGSGRESGEVGRKEEKAIGANNEPHCALGGEHNEIHSYFN